MTEPYTPTQPTISDLRDLWVDHQLNHLPREIGVGLVPAAQECFNQAITQHDREVAAGALRDAATMRLGYSRGAAIAEHHGCHKHQCRCGNPGPEQMIELVTSAWQGALQERAISILHP